MSTTAVVTVGSAWRHVRNGYAEFDVKVVGVVSAHGHEWVVFADPEEVPAVIASEPEVERLDWFVTYWREVAS